MPMLHTSEINMANSVAPKDIDVFLTIFSGPFTLHTTRLFEASPGTALFGRDMQFDISYLAD